MLGLTGPLNMVLNMWHTAAIHPDGGASVAMIKSAIRRVQGGAGGRGWGLQLRRRPWRVGASALARAMAAEHSTAAVTCPNPPHRPCSMLGMLSGMSRTLCDAQLSTLASLPLPAGTPPQRVPLSLTAEQLLMVLNRRLVEVTGIVDSPTPVSAPPAGLGLAPVQPCCCCALWPILLGMGHSAWRRRDPAKHIAPLLVSRR